jgi:hypothetical protein
MLVSLTIVRYRKIFIPFALLAMALHRMAMRMQKKCNFWRLLGTGKDGTFSLNPDWQQWGLLAVWDNKASFAEFYQASFVAKWWDLFSCEKWTVLCTPLQSHGKWDGLEPFGKPNEPIDNKPIAVLTRATIRLSRLKNFWSHVPQATKLMRRSQGYIMSLGIGELPVYRQATFSVWKNIDYVKTFAYASEEHAEVIRKTRDEHWYSEELFARLEPVESFGTIKGINPLDEITL